MAKRPPSDSKKVATSGKPSSLVDTRVVYCGDNLDQLRKLPDACVDLVYIDPPLSGERQSLKKVKTANAAEGESLAILTALRKPRTRNRARPSAFIYGGMRWHRVCIHVMAIADCPQAR